MTSRIVTVGAAQLGPIARDEPRSAVVQRLDGLLRQGADAGCDLAVFPERALTTFFPGGHLTDEAIEQGSEAVELWPAHARLRAHLGLALAQRSMLSPPPTPIQTEHCHG